MAKLFLITILSVFTLLLTAQKHSEIKNTVAELRPTYIESPRKNSQNLLNTIQIVLDKQSNKIYFITPHVIQGVNITVKDRGEKVVVQQTNTSINKEYSIALPEQKDNNKYTVILQKENHLLVERLN